MSVSTEGTFVAVVGPSGAGKDSLIGYAQRTLATDDRFHFPRRVITRAPDETEFCESMSPEAFQSAIASKAFVLHWQAHGLNYGIPSNIKPLIRDGRNIIVNVSRSTIPEIKRTFSRQTVVLVTADADVLAQRLRTRGREVREDQARRLERGIGAKISVEADIIIQNNDSLEAAGAIFVQTLKRSFMTQPFVFGL